MIHSSTGSNNAVGRSRQVRPSSTPAPPSRTAAGQSRRSQTKSTATIPKVKSNSLARIVTNINCPGQTAKAAPATAACVGETHRAASFIVKPIVATFASTCSTTIGQ